MKRQPKKIAAENAHTRARAFTLIEMVTVLTIILIVLAIAIPVWNTLMGGTNLAAAQNEISAFIAGARADAIYNRQPMGVFFYIDPKTQQEAMAEVQVQILWQTHPASGSSAYTSLFQPGTWTAGSPPTWTASTAVNGAINSIELANYPDPNNPGKNVFYRDVTLLPKGVGIALNNNTYTYNTNNILGNTTNGVPPLDRYVRIGAIMFGSDGTLTQTAYGVPLYEYMTQQQTVTYASMPPENALCQVLGMYQSDIASNIVPPAGSAPTIFPLNTSVGFVMYDRDVYSTQHATMQANVGSPPAVTPIGDGAQFSDQDMNYYLPPINGVQAGTTPTTAQQQDKFIEENWIDQNGTAFLINPTSGSLIKAK